MSAAETHLIGLLGPACHGAGLSPDEAGETAYPRAAALSGLEAMRQLNELGQRVAVLPPHARPAIGWLRRLGFSGADRSVWAKAWSADQRLARAAAAPAVMGAGCALASPSADCIDGRVHLTPANHAIALHQAMLAETCGRALARVLADPERFVVHPPLPAHADLADAGGVNHLRLSAGGAGVEAFSAGVCAGQTLEASRAVARRHGLNLARTSFVRLGPQAIAAGAGQLRAAMMAAEGRLFYHEHAVEDPGAFEQELTARARGLFTPQFVRVPAERVSLSEALAARLFCGLLVRPPKAPRLTLLAPAAALAAPAIAAFLGDLTAEEGPIGAVAALEGPELPAAAAGCADLRLPLCLTTSERHALAPGCVYGEALDARLRAWVRAHFREQLAAEDLADPLLVDETHAALDALTELLGLGGDFYDFQAG